MKDLTEVTKELTEVFSKVIKGDLPVDQANTAINTADKIEYPPNYFILFL